MTHKYDKLAVVALTLLRIEFLKAMKVVGNPFLAQQVKNDKNRLEYIKQQDFILDTYRDLIAVIDKSIEDSKNIGNNKYDS